MARKPPPSPRCGQVRCAIYTRKSTEEGLEQAFNSLDAQREACEAYITSQRHEGWSMIPAAYDDGGFSGGTMERPALRRLLADVEAGKVDVIVVYKVDRLTRALSDFAKIVEILDARGASFVSVTQAFNTTSSMGRLTLNVLLSFAQFEREVTGERIRDKIAASKKKGLWMGGPVPLGYVVRERKLVVDEKDAATVRHIFNRYLALGTGQALIEELRAEGYRTRLREQKGRTIGGVPFGRGMLFAMLSNRIYLGEIVHKGQAHPGEHLPIIDRALWDRVQQLIDANRVERKAATNVAHASLLAGILFDDQGRRMTPSHAVRSGKRYRYYITHSSELREDQPAAWRLPAHDIEKAVIGRIQAWLRERRNVAALAADAAILGQALAAASRDADRLDRSHGRRALITALVDRVTVHEAEIGIGIDGLTLGRRLGIELKGQRSIEIVAPAVKLRTGKATRLVVASGDEAQADPALVTLLAEARRVQALLFAHPDMTIKDIAAAHGQCRHRLARLVRLSWLAPEMVTAIVEGRQPLTLTASRLMDDRLPALWCEQQALLAA